MRRVEYFDGLNSRLTRAFLGLRDGDATLGVSAVDLYLPTQSVVFNEGLGAYRLCGLVFKLLLEGFHSGNELIGAPCR